MQTLQTTSTLNNWWDHHGMYGGEVYLVEMPWQDVTHPGEYTDKLFESFRKLDFDDILAFSESNVTDNSMPNREIMEDASKIHMLRDMLQQKRMQFVPQILHEPWYERYRAHPGSGRASAMYLEGFQCLTGVYIHFDHPDFKIPKNAQRLEFLGDFLWNIKFQTPVQPDFETYEAFPITTQGKAKTNKMDSEWKPDFHTATPWEFIRWSEGKNFLEHKYSWRSYAIDLWCSLN